MILNRAHIHGGKRLLTEKETVNQKASIKHIIIHLLRAILLTELSTSAT